MHGKPASSRDARSPSSDSWMDNQTLRSQLLVSDATTGTHGTLRWRLRVRGNTAVEFGVVPADHCSRHGTLHKVRRSDSLTAAKSTVINVKAQLTEGFTTKWTTGFPTRASQLSCSCPIAACLDALTGGSVAEAAPLLW